MEDLSALWEEQAAYNKLVKEQVQNQDWTGTLVLGLLEECAELLRVTGWKKHRKPPVLAGDLVQDSGAVLEELADILKYAVSLCQHLGFPLQDLLAAVRVKNEAMQQRLQQEFAAPPAGRRVLVADMDGTLANFSRGMLEYLQRHGVAVCDEQDINTTTIEASIGLPYPKYWELKRRWEEAGGYRTLEPYADGIDLAQLAKQDGVYLVVVTARPKEIKRIWLDSLVWLLKYDLHPDKLILGESERVLLIQRLKESGCPVVLLEDDPALIQRAAVLCPVLVRTHPYNCNVTGSNIIHTEKFNPIDFRSLWK